MKHITEDIFAEWKQRRFVLVDASLHDSNGQLIILTDFQFWTNHIEQLLEWCNEKGGEVNGSTVLFRNEQEVTAFVLRWS